MEINTFTHLRLVGTSNIKSAYSAPSLKVFGSISGLTLSGGGTRCDATNPGNGVGTVAQSPPPGNVCPSDPSVKENIARIGTHPLGFGIYLFDYKSEFRSDWGHGRQFGVMADEVQLVLPEAVVTRSDGYMAVDYALLGINRTVH